MNISMFSRFHKSEVFVVDPVAAAGNPGSTVVSELRG